LKYTRAMITAALEGKLNDVDYEEHPVFGVLMPKSCTGVPADILNPRNTWNDKEAYDSKATHLAKQFASNFEEFADNASEDIKAGGPKVAVNR